MDEEQTPEPSATDTGPAETSQPSADTPPASDPETPDVPHADGAGGDEASPADTKRPVSTSRSVVEWVVVLFIALLVAFLVRTYVFQTFYIPSGSMEPTLQIGDRIIVSKLSYDIHSVNRGDIVVFHAPPREADACADPAVKDLVKRVIGLPGETISSVGNTVLINGKPLAEPWFPKVPLGPPIPTTHIPANNYFVMGDNRSDSCDSRYWGTVPRSDIIGHVVFRIWPLSQIGVP